MGLGRAVVFGAVAFFPAVIIGVVLFMAMGGPDKPWADWMWVPCYIIPFSIMGTASWYGLRWRAEVEVE